MLYIPEYMFQIKQNIQKNLANIAFYVIQPFTNVKCINTYLHIIKFIYSNNYITYNGGLFRQLNGTPMDNSISIKKNNNNP